MNCENVERLISAYVDRELSKDAEVKIRHHLAYCTTCFEIYEQLRKAKELLSSVPSSDLPAGFWAETKMMFHPERQTSGSRFLGIRSMLAKAWAPIALAASLILTISTVSLAPGVQVLSGEADSPMTMIAAPAPSDAAQKIINEFRAGGLLALEPQANQGSADRLVSDRAGSSDDQVSGLSLEQKDKKNKQDQNDPLGSAQTKALQVIPAGYSGR